MKEILEKLVGVIPLYLNDFLSLVAGPKRFVASLSEDESALERAAIFLGVSFAISWIIKTPFMRIDPLVELASDAAFVLIYVVGYGGALRIAWRLVGSKAALKSFFVVHFYYSGVLLLIMACSFLASIGVLRAGDPGLYKGLLEATYSGNLPAFMIENMERLSVNPTFRLSSLIATVGCTSGGVWLVVGWGAYRSMSQLTRLRSAFAGILFILFCLPVAAIAFFIANALVSGPK